ncbi:MAG: outer membrane beta-barrel protein [Gammaproteobacteria bacterium]|nr:outer membrane beta-barrel protein [Gammaproteobacteria bacterium]MXX94532.1 outer membrane beta-barrel protein [Gammaproteobacteria bacterium]MYK44435.1 outer membrane beta-barrel protein [Gammaproteobacteria bacterium]
MKFFICLISALVMSLPVFAHEATKESEQYFSSNWYFLIEGSHYTENDDRGVGDGSGIRYGGGIQFNKIFGLELAIDHVPEYEASYEFDDVSRRAGKYVDKAENHVYSSLLCTFRVPIDETVDFVWKLGLSSYRYDLFMEFENDHRTNNGEDESNRSILGYKKDESGVTLAGSVGVEFPFGRSENLSVEVSLTRLLGDDSAGASLNAGLKFSF